MPAQPVTEHVYCVQNEDVKVFIIEQPDGLTVIDAGFPGTMALIDEAVRSLGRDPEEIRDILVTHCHPDHAGGLAEIVSATGARVWMHPADAEMVRSGTAFRPYQVSPGAANQAFVDDVISHSPQTYEPAPVDEEVLPGDEIPVAGGITALGAPGHTVGHLVFLWSGDDGVLFLGDAAKNVDGLVPCPIYEDVSQGLESLQGLSGHDFEVACFAHGDPIVESACEVFRRRWI
jgi:glyoxylase-like metal-dependent hydrolase (beta-lactamase superfamily II)